MASSTETRAPCATCNNKTVGIFKCEGCSQIFCRKHVNEHRDILGHQLDEIVVEHDVLQQMIAERSDQSNDRHSLLEQIDRWEKNSIMKIQQSANEAREQVEELTDLQKGKISKELRDLAERLQKARIDDDYVETDLHKWTTTLEKLRSDVKGVSPTITVYENPTSALVGKLTLTGTKQSVEQQEKFGESFGDVRVEKNGYVVIHGNTNSSHGFIRGTNEYSTGKHAIRFVVQKKNIQQYMAFGVISKSKSLPRSENAMKIMAYGWKSNDKTMPLSTETSVGKDVQDMRGYATFEIELLLDCDHRKISYFNQTTKIKREMNVDNILSPLPWQLCFYLFAVDDCIQLICSNSAV